MLSIEEIKLLIEKLEKAKQSDLEDLIDKNLNILKDIAAAVDANNQQQIDRLDKTLNWFRKDLEQKRKAPAVDQALYRQVQTKIFQFARSPNFNCLEIGPGLGTFSKEFRAWRKNYFLDIDPVLEKTLRRRFKPPEQKNLVFYITKKHECSNIPQSSCNFIFSWDTFVFFTLNHIQHYLHDIKRVLIPGGYAFIQYADCHFDFDLEQAKRGYWNYNTKTTMQKMVSDEGYQVIETNQFCTGANYIIFRKPGKQNPIKYKISEISID